ncbi:hypothetical protein PHYBOEH_000816 [Phytophthora boehmeriae]|uniref:NYN domain-containing protein n=1 Tax=Phytophthora boehmeriae TaxID=109152 RepID=A0A8T1X0S7_9STRA|nr:hypothetical protein PHYBOEH_000816 [Phytophthora boehmeriae]
MAPAASKTTALIVDGAYARIQGRILGGGVDFARLRTVLEREAGAVFEECWYFDNLGGNGQCHAAMTVEYNALKRARPHGPQFQVQLYPLKKYKCFCKRCDNRYVQMVQKGVDNGIATKMLRLTLKHGIERIILVSGDGDFYATLNSLRNEDRKEVWVAGG